MYSSAFRKVDDDNNKEISLLLHDSQTHLPEKKTISMTQIKQTYQRFVEDTDSRIWSMTSPVPY